MTDSRPFSAGVSHATVKIVADTGEVPSRIPQHLGELGAVVEVVRLLVADYLVGDGVGVERKTVADLHRSLAGGRLWAQLLACRRELARTYLLVEGVDLDKGSVSASGVRGALLEIGDRGVTVVRSSNAADTALWLLRLAVRLQRSRRAGTPQVRRFPKASTPRLLLSEVPGVGPETAAALLDRFGSLRGIANANPNDLLTVAGVGPKRAATLARLLVD